MRSAGINVHGVRPHARRELLVRRRYLYMLWPGDSIA